MPNKIKIISEKMPNLLFLWAAQIEAIINMAKIGPLCPMRITINTAIIRQSNNAFFPQRVFVCSNSIIGPLERRMSRDPAGIGLDEKSKIRFPG